MREFSSWLCGGLIFVALTSCKPKSNESPGRSETRSSASPQEVYETHCAACHGQTGDGNGPAAVWLFPKPRNFSAGLFKIKSTSGSALPSEDDLFQTITRGMPGSSMPSFSYLSEEDRRRAVQHVKFLAAHTDGEGNRINHFDEEKKKLPPPVLVEVPPEPAATLEGMNQGKELFKKLNCSSCHGETGSGDGPSAPTLKDNWGVSLPPRDFNSGAFRGGHTGRDLYLRIATGLAGTPMVAFGDDVITKEQRWALVLYIQSLRRKEVEINDILTPQDGMIRAKRVKQLPVDPMDPYWESLDPVRIPLNPLWPAANPISAVAVRAVHDGNKVAFLLQWRDGSANGAAVRVQDFQDAVAIQYPLGDSIPFLGMGDSKHPVNIWQWKAGWQQEPSGARPDVQTTYASMHVDLYQETNALYRPAEFAGNLLAQPAHNSPIEDANAQGFGTMKSQAADAQNVKGRGIWLNGHWNVIFVREMASKDSQDVHLAVGKPKPLAFAVWDGQQRDRNGKKVVSNWHHLLLEP